MTKTALKCATVLLIANVGAAQEATLRVNLSDGTTRVVEVSSEGLTDANVTAQPVPAVVLPVTPVTPQVAPQTPGPAPRSESTPGRRGKSRMVPILPKEFETYDKNGDGQIGMYEWERSRYAEFVKLDKNGDGFLTPQELNAKGNLFGGRGRGGVMEKDALPNPGNLASYGQKVGESFTFSVTGRTTGPVYGSGPYTADTDLATAAVHAGLLKDGEKGTVYVTIVETPNQFTSTSANGVNSTAWGAYPAAYTVK